MRSAEQNKKENMRKLPAEETESTTTGFSRLGVGGGRISKNEFHETNFRISKKIK